MKMRFLPLTTILLLNSTVFLSCSKDDPSSRNQNPPSNPLSITSINPSIGGYNTIVTITGTNFSSNRAEDTVKFNGKIGAILIAETNKIIVSVPLLAGTGPVTVTVGNNIASGPVFTYKSNTVITFAGTGVRGHADGISTIAQFDYPTDIALDAQGNIYVSDNYQIRKITPSGIVSTLAGSGIRGFYDGPADSARFNSPEGIAVDIQGNVYVADGGNARIRKVTPNGKVSTLAGNGTYNYVDGIGVNAGFSTPRSVAADAQGNIYVADKGNYRVRKITPGGVVSTLAGKGIAGYANGTGINAEFYSLGDIAVDDQGNIYVTDWQRIRKITPDGVVSTYAGSGAINVLNAVGINADFDNPNGLCIDRNGNIYIGEESSLIRKIDASTTVSTFAGTLTIGYVDGAAETAKFRNPKGTAVDAAGNVYVADFANHCIRKITIQ